ncbi:MAG: peptidase S8/S53 subtilisin kexin sedolisin [Isosphaeraceae bacterium]
MNRRPRKNFRARCEQLEDRGLLSMLTPAQVRQAYGMNAIEFSANGRTIQGTGAGQTIAIVGAFHNPFVTDELYAFDAAYGLSNPALVQVNLAGAQTNIGWAEEEALDVEWSHVMAPRASIIVVEAASANTSDLMNAVNLARKLPGVSVVSMSWGGSEFRGQTTYDPFFTTPPGHNGVTFVTASGDNGSKYGADWPASSPNVVGVGGTTLWADAAGNTLLETAWSSSGGGFSVLEREPGYQRTVQRKGRRSTPDVAMVADPNTGVPVVVLDPSTGQVSWGTYGGTSLSAQLFGGLIAVADQGRALAGLGTLDGATQTLPLLYSVPASDFRDVIYGSNGHRATAGYDLVTGLGTPRGAALVSDLSNPDFQAVIRKVLPTKKAPASPKKSTRPKISNPAMHRDVARVRLTIAVSPRLSDPARSRQAVEPRLLHARARNPG